MSVEERQEVFAYLRSVLPKHPMEERLMISPEAMLDAFARSGDFTVRMIRGVFAEAAFAADVLPTLRGWRELPIRGDPPFDFCLTDTPVVPDMPNAQTHTVVKLQVKMQRSRAGVPLMASEVWKTATNWPSTYYVVEVQKSRKGQTKDGKQTRPIRFGEFDILGVSLGPSRGRWSDFMFTLERWLLPNPLDTDEILKYQPVAPHPTDHWTSSFEEAVRWLRGGDSGRIEGDLPAY